MRNKITAESAFLLYVVTLFVIAWFPQATLSQVSKVDQANETLKKWQIRVGELGNGIEQDSTKLSEADQALYFALHAKIMWSQDQEMARKLLNRSIQPLLQVVSSRDQTELTKSLVRAEASIEIISKLDSVLAEKLVNDIAKIIAENQDSNSTRENSELAQLIVKLGVQVVKAKPETAMRCGLASLKYGYARSLPELIAELNLVEPNLAETVYLQANAKLGQDYSTPAILFEINLSNRVFGLFGEWGYNVSFKKRYLNNYVDRLNLAARDEVFRDERCKMTAFSGDMFARIDQFLPVRSVEARQSYEQCSSAYAASSSGKFPRRPIFDSTASVDDLISLARSANDTHIKVTYWREALSILGKRKNYLESISILDSTVGDDLKNAAPIVWNNWRSGAASELAIIQFNEQSIPDAYRTIERTPRELRPEVRLDVAKKLSAAKKTTFYSDNIDAMVKDLSGIDIPDIESVGFYLALSNLMLDVRPLESESMFRLAAKHINKVDAANPDSQPDKDWEWDRYYIRLDARLLEFDESGITSALGSIGSRRSRVRLKLGLLETSLVKQATAKKLVESLVKVRATKGKNN